MHLLGGDAQANYRDKLLENGRICAGVKFEITTIIIMIKLFVVALKIARTKK